MTTKRQELDNYPTPPALAQAMVERVIQFTGAPLSVLEPSAGDGNFVRALRAVEAAKHWPGRMSITALEPRAAAAKRIGEGELVVVTTLEKHLALKPMAGRPFWDLAIGNPPFSRAQQHIELLLPRVRFLAFLLRMSFLGSQERARTLWRQPNKLRMVVPLAERPSFVGGKTDNSEYAIFIWQHNHSGHTELAPHLFWRT